MLDWAGADALGGVYSLGRRPAAGGGFEHVLVLSHDDGESWDPRSPLILGAPGKFHARAAVSAGGQLVLVFSDGASVTALASEDQGRSFAEPVLLGPVEGFAIPRIAMADDGRTLVTWLLLSGGTSRILAVVSPDHGRTWGPLRTLRETEPPFDLRPPRPLVTTGAVIVSWSEEVAGDEALLDRAFTSTSIDRGESWFSPRRVSVADDTTGWVVLATTSLNEVQALYGVRLGPREVELRVNGSFNAGFAWSDVDEAVSPILPFDDGWLFSFPDGSTWVLWFERDDPEVPDIGAIATRRSGAHGRPGTWEAPSRVAEEGFDQHAFRLVQGPGGVVDLVHTDYREQVRCPYPPEIASCESVYLNHSCDRGSSWTGDELRLDSDAGPNAPHSEEPQVVRSPSGRLHVFFTNNSSAAEDFEDQLVHVGLDPRGPTPELSVEAHGPSGCTGSSHVFNLVSSTIDWCDEASLAWFVDGELVPGAEADSFELPGDLPPGEHDVRAELWCGGEVGCLFRSETHPVLVEAGRDSQVEGRRITGPLLVEKGPGPDELSLGWTDLDPAATGYHVMRGSLASLVTPTGYDHEGEPCRLPRPPAAPLLELPVERPPADSYWLVVPADCAGVGEAGPDSRGLPRPVAPGTDCGTMPE